MDTKELINQLNYIKIRALSIASMIQNFNDSNQLNKELIDELLSDIESDKSALEIHLGAAYDAYSN